MIFYSVLLLFLAQLSSQVIDGIFLMPPFVFQTSTKAPDNKTAGSFTSNISFGDIVNTTNVVVAVSQNMGRAFALDESPLAARRINTSVFMFKDGNWTSFRLRKRRALYNLGNTLTAQVFDGVSKYFNNTVSKEITADWIQNILNTSMNTSGLNLSARSLRSAAASPCQLTYSDVPNILPGEFDLFFGQLKNENGLFSTPDFVLNYINNLSLANARAVAEMRNELENLFGLFNMTQSSTQDIFSGIENYFQRLAAIAGVCFTKTYPALGSLLTDTAEAVEQCLANKLSDGIEIAGKAMALVRSSVEFPGSITKQFTSCLDKSGPYSTLLQGICLSKLPLELTRFGVQTGNGWAQSVNNAREYFANIKTDMLNCGANGIDIALTWVENWQSEYESCLQNNQ